MKMKNTRLLMAGTILAWLPAATMTAATYAIATRDVQLNGNNVFVDSFDSTDPLRSTDGRYDPLKGGGDAAVVGSELGIHNANNVGTVSLLGRLETSWPFSLEMGAQSSIGSIAWHQAGMAGIEPGYHTTNFTFTFPDPVPPFAGFVPASGVYDGVFYNYLLDSDGNYELPSLTLSGGQKMLVTHRCALYVKGNATLSGNALIQILPSASLVLYVNGTANLRGAGIVNQGASGNFTFAGVGSNPSLNLRVTTPFSGVIYVPSGVCTITSGGGTAADLQGAVFARTVVLGTPINLHFDEGL
jgi:hypothetical protein